MVRLGELLVFILLSAVILFAANRQPPSPVTIYLPPVTVPITVVPKNIPAPVRKPRAKKRAAPNYPWITTIHRDP